MSVRPFFHAKKRIAAYPYAAVSEGCQGQGVDNFWFYGISVSAVAFGLTVFSGDVFAPDIKAIEGVIPILVPSPNAVIPNAVEQQFKEQLQQQISEQFQDIATPLLNYYQADRRFEVFLQGQNIQVRLKLRIVQRRQESILLFRIENISDPLLRISLPDRAGLIAYQVTNWLATRLPQLAITKVKSF